MQNEPVVITRGQIGQWASFIGGGSLLVGIIGFIWQAGLTPVILAALLIGLLGIAVWAMMTPQEFRGFITGRQVRRSTTSVFGTLLLIGIVSLVYILLQRAAITIDMTESLRFSISSETQAVLRRVNQPLRITGFYSASALRQREIDDQIFRLYEAETNGLISREYIDPDKEPARAQAFGAAQDGSVFIAYLKPDGTVDFNTLARVPLSGNQERDMTGAIARLLVAGTITVYFDVGKGELDPLDTSQQGLSGINNGMRENGIITGFVNLAELASAGTPIPADAAAVILARPINDLTAAEIAVLDAYLKQGGSLLILADPLFNPDPFLADNGTFSQFLWNNFGIKALDAVVVDPGSSARTALDVISAAVFTATSLGARLDSENAPTLFSVARALEVNDTPPAYVTNGRVIMSSPQSYGEKNFQALAETNTYRYDEGQDILGPLTTVAWAWNQQTNARILLVGDSDFVTNGLILTGGNSILFTDGIAWLTDFSERINFAPQAFSTGLPLIFLDAQTLDLIAFFTVIVMPGAVLITGLFVWARRRRQV